MKILSILSEGISPIVYHGTEISSLISILQTNSIRLSRAFNSQVETKFGSHPYFLSTARTRTGGYHSSRQDAYVLIELDGTKLSRNLPGKPIDFFAGDPDPEYNEQEDRIFSNKPTIDNISQYMRRVDVLLGQPLTKRVQMEVAKLYVMLKKYGIPTRIYDDRGNWLTGSKNTTRKNVRSWITPGTFNYSHSDSDDRKYRVEYNSQVYAIIKALKFDNLKWFSLKEKLELYDILKFSYFDEFVLRRAGSDRSMDITMGKLQRLMRDNNLRSPAELFKFLKNKWEPILQNEHTSTI